MSPHKAVHSVKRRVVKLGMPHPPAQTVDQAHSETVDFISGQLDLWRDKITLMQNALDWADKAYGDIMQHKTVPSLGIAVFETVFMTGMFALLPQFACLGAIAEKLKWKAESLEKIEKAVEFARDAAKDARETVVQAGENQETSEDMIATRDYAVAFFQNMYANLANISHSVTIAKIHLLRYLDRSPAPMRTKVLKVQGAWLQAGLGISEKSFDVRQLALFFLYDMMRGYTRQSVRLKAGGTDSMLDGAMEINKAAALRAMNDGMTNIQFEGLDSARRESMYGYFFHIQWVDPKRPRILAPPNGNGWKDLLKYWEFSE
jgi:hypothetical protein